MVESDLKPILLRGTQVEFVLKQIFGICEELSNILLFDTHRTVIFADVGPLLIGLEKGRQNTSLPVLVLRTEKEGDSRSLKQQGPFLNAKNSLKEILKPNQLMSLLCYAIFPCLI